MHSPWRPRPSKKQQVKRRARNVLEKLPVLGWRTTDEDELNLRRWRGRTEMASIEVLDAEHGAFGTFRVRSNSGSAYEVEIRDLAGRNNSCGCIDHRVNAKTASATGKAQVSGMAADCGASRQRQACARGL